MTTTNNIVDDMLLHVEGSCPCCGRLQTIEVDLDCLDGIRWIPQGWTCIEELKAEKVMKDELEETGGI